MAPLASQTTIPNQQLTTSWDQSWKKISKIKITNHSKSTHWSCPCFTWHWRIDRGWLKGKHKKRIGRIIQEIVSHGNFYLYEVEWLSLKRKRLLFELTLDDHAKKSLMGISSNLWWNDYPFLGRKFQGKEWGLFYFSARKPWCLSIEINSWQSKTSENCCFKNHFHPVS